MQGGGHNPQLWHFFQQVDTDRSGFIDVLELQRAFQLAGLSFSQQLCAQMIRLHDRSRRKVIDFTSFTVRPKLHTHHSNDALLLRTEPAQLYHQHTKRVLPL